MNLRNPLKGRIASWATEELGEHYLGLPRNLLGGDRRMLSCVDLFEGFHVLGARIDNDDFCSGRSPSPFFWGDFPDRARSALS